MSVFTRLVDEKRPKVNVSEDSILSKKLKDAIINGGFLADLFDALDKVDEKQEFEYYMTHKIYLNTFYDDRLKLYILKEVENEYTEKITKMLNRIFKEFKDTLVYNFKLVQEDVGIKDPYIIYVTVNVTELKKLIDDAKK